MRKCKKIRNYIIDRLKKKNPRRGDARAKGLPQKEASPVVDSIIRLAGQSQSICSENMAFNVSLKYLKYR